MKEIKDIIKAYRQAVAEKRKTALATVVKVDGSSYRRAGARILLTDQGMLTGAISGGCLEGDALRKALTVIHAGENRLVTYDTADEDDAKFGVQLRCNGIFYILFEPIDSSSADNPISILEWISKFRENAAIAVLFSLDNRKQVGTYLALKSWIAYNLASDNVPMALRKDLGMVLNEKRSAVKDYYLENGEKVSAFLEFLPPPISIIIVGGGNDAQPLSRVASLIGWHIVIVDDRPTHATPQRFPEADQVLVANPEKVLLQLAIDKWTAFVLMMHNYNYELALLGQLLSTDAGYIGTLGPRSKLIRMLEEIPANEQTGSDRIYGPVGLDIGAETAEEIAISVIAEIKAVFSDRSAGKLREK